MGLVALYRRLIAVSIRSQMQYRASFLMLSFGTLVTASTEFLAIWALFARFGTIKSWRLPEAALLYGLVNTTFAIADAVSRGFDTFAGMIRMGDLDRVLLRPRSVALQVAGREFQMMRVGRFAQGVAVLAWSWHALGLGPELERIALAGAAVVGGVALFYGLIVVQATLAFWTTEGLEVVNMVTYGGTEVSQYPMHIYGARFRRFFTFVIPLACIAYLPALAIMGKPDPLGSTPTMQTTAPLAGIVFLILAGQAWRFGLRHYRSTGS